MRQRGVRGFEKYKYLHVHTQVVSSGELLLALRTNVRSIFTRGAGAAVALLVEHLVDDGRILGVVANVDVIVAGGGIFAILRGTRGGFLCL